MRVRAVEVYGYELTYAHGRYVMSGGRVVERLPSTVVRVVADEGVDGWGEVCPLGSTYLPAFASGARAALRELAPVVVGADPRNLADVHARMDAALAGHAYAKSVVDVACWDLLGRVAGLPVAALLGGVHRERFPLYVAVPLAPAEAMADFAARHRAQGVGVFQLKLGTDPFADSDRVAAVAEAVGPGCWILADANGAYTVQQAVVLGRLLEKHPQVLLEQPCASLEECLTVRARTTLPMVYDEVVTDARSLVRAAEDGGAAAVNLKTSRVGGLVAARFLRDLAVALGLQLVVEDTWGGDLVTASTAHVAASTPPRSLLAASFMNDWNLEHVAGGFPRSEAGQGVLPPGPGLGVEVDRSALELLFSVP
ncbi:MAG: mandelate racemase/muconate lactonizing enzyme family protein [Armatimonadota bacterium]|nr:mandelate racemase/muconate lactonizing enzyme family protein [Armatimonadota bacterium]MDR7386701.1 mandelate racemase/muconate lactonizing enzyme family protein [Armatimonadota bacterium]MDR7388540.1 mandelate racemase/muconate lactonizing enzyme family protein [Armatimonadota bacterium]MDR7394122.1 mandelate racemase/muconate lactonizing enzyme family protein [Armatimonadota bacterium]MDR7396298.1 mandelate racemase/muconate lactonizing enzyme family protein [Armatimonadota bacterium]